MEPGLLIGLNAEGDMKSMLICLSLAPYNTQRIIYSLIHFGLPEVSTYQISNEACELN